MLFLPYGVLSNTGSWLWVAIETGLISSWHFNLVEGGRG